jgi:protein phosphatase
MLDLKKFLGISSGEGLSAMAFGATHIGQVRPKNEDYLLINSQKHLFIVSDGMGGHNAGEVASFNAARAVDAYFSPALLRRLQRHPKDIRKELNIGIKQAHQKLTEMGAANPKYSGMGCTIVVALIIGDVLHLAHVGDSRAYLTDGKELQLLTTDHTFVMEMVKKGKMKMEDVRNSSMKNHLSQALGVPIAIRPEYIQQRLKREHKILLCTDGLWATVDEYEIFKILIQDKNQKQLSHELIDSANRAGGKDNITCVVIEPVFDNTPPLHRAGEYHIVYSYPHQGKPD